MFATDLKCTDCTTSFPLDEKIVHCTNCRSVLDIVYDQDRIRRNANKESLKNRVHSLWRYRESLPISRRDCIVSLGEGFTPLTQVSRYAGEMGLSRLAVKLDYLNPTGSFKDRGTTVNVTQLKAMGINAVMDDSSGNAGSSLAAYCAAAGIRCTLYVPATAPSLKLLQAEVYGVVTKEVTDLIEMVAQKEGLLVDPVYTGKGILGLLGLAKKGYFSKGSRVLFIHTGGLPIIFSHWRPNN